MRSRLIIVSLAVAMVGLLFGLKLLLETPATDEETKPVERQAPWPVVRGSVGGEDPLWYVAFKRKEGVELCPLEPSNHSWCHDLDGMPMAELLTLDAGAWSRVSIFRLDERPDGEVPPEALALSAFVTRATADSRVTDSREYDREIDAKAAAFCTNDRGDVDEDKLRAWTLANAKDDALFERFRRHHPIGTCSMDPIPHVTTVVFAELALARGDIPTFIDLQLRLLSGRHERVAWSSFSDDSQPTRAERFAAAKVDVDALLLGLVIQHPGSKSANEQRIARAMREAGRAEALLPRVEALVTMRNLDAYDRYRATSVWVLLQLHDEASMKNAPAVRARAAQLELDALSRSVVERMAPSP